jgi:type I restriction enzyme S subunit
MSRAKKASPRRWPRRAISEVAEVNPRTPVPIDWKGSHPVPHFGMAAIDEFIGTLREPDLIPLEQCRSGKSRFRNDDVLFAKITPCVQNQKSALVTGLPSEIGFGSSEFYVLRASEGILPEYLFFFLRQKEIVEKAVESFVGSSGRQRVPSTFWKDLKIPLPQLAVQEQIIAILKKADEIRCKRQNALNTADAILPAIFNETFGNPTANPHNYLRTTLGRSASLVTSGYTPRGGATNYISEGPLLIRSQNVRMLHLDLDDCAHLPQHIHEEMSRVRVMPGDVLLNITGASIGRVAWAPEDIPPANVNQHVCIIRLNSQKLLPEYVAFTLASSWYQHIILNAPGSAQTGFNHERVRGLEILVPPLAVQKSFVNQVLMQRSVVERQNNGLDIAQITFQSLMSQAFGGELTVEWEAVNSELIVKQQRLYERLPQLLLLAFLHEKQAKSKAAKKSLLVTALMKYVFLFQMEATARRRLYHFIPYHYGPFAKELYSDLESLRQQGFITIDNGDDVRTRITITSSGELEAIFSDLPEDIQEDVAAIVEAYGGLSHSDLLQEVYEKYPAYAQKSRLKRPKR